MYFTAAKISPLERNLYRVSITGKKESRLTEGAGCHVITAIGGNIYFLDKLSSLNVPPVYRLLDKNGKIVRTLEDNAALVQKMTEYNLGKVSFFKVQGDGGLELNAWRIVPLDFDSTKKYPVLMYQYSGPGSQEVADRFPNS